MSEPMDTDIPSAPLEPVADQPPPPTRHFVMGVDVTERVEELYRGYAREYIAEQAASAALRPVGVEHLHDFSSFEQRQKWE